LAIKEKNILNALTKSDSKNRLNSSKDCPFILECNSGVTKNFFQRICNTNNHNNCHHYARKLGELVTPMVWLQKKAVQDNNKKDNSKLANLLSHKIKG